MKHIKLFEQFVESVSESKKFSDAFAVLDFFGGALPNDYSKALTAARKAGYDLPTSLYYEAADLAQDGVNEDLGVIDIALGVAAGIAGLWAVVQGLPLVGRALGNAAEALADQVEARVKSVAKGKRKGLIEEIVKKFDSDTKLKQMYQDLPEYMERGDHNRIIRNNTERRKQLTAIGNYIKTKLTPEEMQYFTDISSMLRTGDIK